jgi:hypothetical protein
MNALLLALTLAAPAVSVEPSRLAPLLQGTPPRVGWCLLGRVSNRDVERIWRSLRVIEGEQEGIFRSVALERATLAVPAEDYPALFPYRRRCSLVEPALYYCIEQLRRDADVLDERLLGRPVTQVSAARSGGAVTKMPIAVERFFRILLASLERIHAVNGRLPRRARTGQESAWPERSLEKLTSSEAVELFARRLEALADESRTVREELEARRGHSN